MLIKILYGLVMVFLFCGQVCAGCIPDDVRMMSAVYKGDHLYMIQRCSLVEYTPGTNPHAEYDWRNIINPTVDFPGVRKQFKKMKKEFQLDQESKELESLKWKVMK